MKTEVAKIAKIAKILSAMTATEVEQAMLQCSNYLDPEHVGRVFRDHLSEFERDEMLSTLDPME